MGQNVCLRKLRSCGRSCLRTLRRWGSKGHCLLVCVLLHALLALVLGAVFLLAPEPFDSLEPDTHYLIGISLVFLGLAMIFVMTIAVSCSERCRNLNNPLNEHIEAIRDDEDMVELEEKQEKA